jgi:hypothetical protein
VSILDFRRMTKGCTLPDNALIYHNIYRHFDESYSLHALLRIWRQLALSKRCIYIYTYPHTQCFISGHRNLLLYTLFIIVNICTYSYMLRESGFCTSRVHRTVVVLLRCRAVESLPLKCYLLVMVIQLQLRKRFLYPFIYFSSNFIYTGENKIDRP